MKKITMEYIEKKIEENSKKDKEGNIIFPRKLKHWEVMKEDYGKKKKGLVEIEEK